MKRVALPLILIFGGAAAAQVPASLPAPAPAVTGPAPQPTPASGVPVTQPTSAATAETAPAAAQAAATEPTSRPASDAFATTAPATAPFASSPSSQGSSSYPYARSNRFGEAPLAPTSSYAADLAGMPNLKPKAYPNQYGALLKRSIFIHGSQIVRDPWHNPDDVSRPSDNSPIRPSNPSPNAEGVLVFNGASDVDGQLVAFIENTGMNQITRYHVGDPVGQGAQGKIAAITLDSIDYQVGSKITHVMLGQNLSGQETQVLTTQPVAGTSSFGGSGSSSGAPATGPSSTSGGSTDSILERLRKRRMQELGQ